MTTPPTHALTPTDILALQELPSGLGEARRGDERHKRLQTMGLAYGHYVWGHGDYYRATPSGVALLASMEADRG